MTAYYRPKLGSAWLPLPITSWTETPTADLDARDIPLEAGRTMVSAKRGTVQISISGVVPGAPYVTDRYKVANAWTTENARTYRSAMEATLVGAKGLNLYRWSNRYYADCAVQSMIFSEFRDGRPYIAYSIDVVAHDPVEKTDTALADSTPWIEFIEGGAGGTGLEEVAPLLTGYTQNHGFMFPGLAEASAEDADAQIVAIGPPSSTLEVKQIVITSAQVVAAMAEASTVIRIAKSSINSGAGAVSVLTLAGDAAQGSAFFASGLTVDTDANGISDPIYVYIYTPGSHSDIRGYITTKYGS